VIGSLRGDASLADVEQSVLGFDHRTLGERVMEEWRFPESIIAAARYHHQAFGCPKEFLDVVQCVEVANLICSLKGITSVGTNLVAFSSDAILSLSLSGNDLAVLADDLDAELAANEHVFEIYNPGT
jgi:HD-like signal output (HDOD) protein